MSESAAREALRDELRALLGEDAHNAQRILAQLESMRSLVGIGAHAALLLALTRKVFADDEAAEHWRAIVAHRQQMSSSAERDVGLRVAALDYFINVNRALMQPTLIDMTLLEAAAIEGGRDSTTGLSTERSFREAITAEIRRARRYGFTTAVLLFDVDDFSAVADQRGTIVGDRVLREIAILVRNKVRDIDIVARVGDDELAILLPETGRNSALLVADRCRVAVERHFGPAPGHAQGSGMTDLTLSGGVAVYPRDGVHADAILSKASQALYNAKAQGKNRVQPYEQERRRFVRFDLIDGPFEMEILGGSPNRQLPLVNVSCEGLLFRSPEPIDVGERVELRLLAESAADEPVSALRGQVVRLEQLEAPEVAEADERSAAAAEYEIGLLFDRDSAPSRESLMRFLACGQQRAERDSGRR